jgi:hypothetical protein
MRLPAMTTQRWMVFVAAFASTLTIWIAFQCWVDARVAGFLQRFREQAGLPPEEPLGDYVIALPRGMGFWIDIDNFLHRFWFVLAILAFLFSFSVAASFPLGKAGSKLACLPVQKK